MLYDSGLWRRLTVPILALVLVMSMILPACGTANKNGGSSQTETAEFQLDQLTISPAQGTPNQAISINTTVRNVGSRDGTYSAELQINGHVVDAKDISVPASSSRQLTFSVSESEPGTYDVVLGDRQGSFTIKNPQLNLALDYVGVKDAGGGNIRLLVLIDTGQTNNETVWIPILAADSMKMSDYSIMPKNQTLLHMDSASDYLKILIIGYDQIPKNPPNEWATIGTLVGLFFGNPGLGGQVGGLIDTLTAPTADYNYIGSYQATWTAGQSWGIERYDGVGTDNLRLWFRIWSDLPQQIAEPPTLVPGVAIQDVNVPSLVAVDEDYTQAITLRNDELDPVTVTLARHSSATGITTEDNVTISAGHTLNKTYSLRCESAGVMTLTYTVKKPDGTQVDILSKSLEARERFAGWYVDGNRVTSASKSSTVTAKFNVFDMTVGNYTMRIGRDISWASDQVVTSTSFHYDGTPQTVQLSFVPPYATGEASTRGYWVDLVGAQSMSFSDTYPPRLVVGY